MEIDLPGPISRSTGDLVCTCMCNVQINRDNHNVLKIDIEGAEYDVIDHLLNTGAHEYIDEWLVEFTCKFKLPESYNEEVLARFESTIPNYVDWGKVKFSEERNKFRGDNALKG